VNARPLGKGTLSAQNTHGIRVPFSEFAGLYIFLVTSAKTGRESGEHNSCTRRTNRGERVPIPLLQLSRSKASREGVDSRG